MEVFTMWWRVVGPTLVLIAALVQAAGCMPRPDPIMNPRNGWFHLGQWSGVGVQTGGQSWPVTVNIRSVQPGVCAEATYPSIPCTAFWTCMPGFDGHTLNAYESITSGNCIPGNISATPTQTGGLEFRQSVQGIEARAILERVR